MLRLWQRTAADFAGLRGQDTKVCDRVLVERRVTCGIPGAGGPIDNFFFLILERWGVTPSRDLDGVQTLQKHASSEQD
eukprot:4192179-Pleurochrysis_carterae.AAC.1